MEREKKDLLDGIAFLASILARTGEYIPIELLPGEDYDLEKLIDSLEGLRTKKGKE